MNTIKERTEIARESKRNIPEILKEIESLATMSNDVALSCFYVVFNKRDKKPFVGVSVRFAELVASCWQNIEAGARIISNNGIHTTVQGFVQDFEKNAIFTVEVQRNISKLNSTQAIQAATSASSIAFRNAVFKAVPAALFSTAAKSIKSFIVEGLEGDDVGKKAVDYYTTKGIKREEIENLLGTTLEDIDSESIFLLIGLKNAIEDGDTTLEEAFGRESAEKPMRSSKFQFEPLSEEQMESRATREGDTKEQLKQGISELEAEPEPEEDPKEEPKEEEEPPKKRGRGRPKKKKE